MYKNLTFPSVQQVTLDFFVLCNTGLFLGHIELGLGLKHRQHDSDSFGLFHSTTGWNCAATYLNVLPLNHCNNL